MDSCPPQASRGRARGNRASPVASCNDNPVFRREVIGWQALDVPVAHNGGIRKEAVACEEWRAGHLELPNLQGQSCEELRKPAQPTLPQHRNTAGPGRLGITSNSFPDRLEPSQINPRKAHHTREPLLSFLTKAGRVGERAGSEHPTIPWLRRRAGPPGPARPQRPRGAYPGKEAPTLDPAANQEKRGRSLRAHLLHPDVGDHLIPVIGQEGPHVGHKGRCEQAVAHQVAQVFLQALKESSLREDSSLPSSFPALKP